jgi:cyclase
MSSVTGAIEVLETVVARIPATVVVPGHGAPTTLGLVDSIVDYLNFVLDIATEGRAEGLTPLQAAREVDLGSFREWSDAERLAGALHRACADLEPDHHQVDVGAYLTDLGRAEAIARLKTAGSRCQRAAELLANGDAAGAGALYRKVFGDAFPG